MSKSKKSLTLRFERVLAASPAEAHDAWLDPKTPGNPWNMGDKLLLNPKVDGFFYWFVSGTPHYGRFIEVERPGRIQHTWVSPYTLGEESTVTVTFEKQGKDTLMTLVHSDLPTNEKSKAHEGGWNSFMDSFSKGFAKATRKKK